MIEELNQDFLSRRVRGIRRKKINSRVEKNKKDERGKKK